MSRRSSDLSMLDIACLGHESVNHPMKSYSVISAALGQRRDLLDMIGSYVRQHLDLHGAVFQLNVQEFLGHVFAPWC